MQFLKGEGNVNVSAEVDPELYMEKELEKKKAIATRISESAIAEFTNEYETDYGAKPDFKDPAINWFLNGWLAAHKDREWLTPEEKRIMMIRKVASEKRRKTMEANRLKAREAR